jgi:hypothetical protein
MDKRGSVFLDPRLLAGILIQGRLNRCPQPALVVFLERNEAEWLPGIGDGAQHFRRAQYRARSSQEHQLDAGTPIQHVRQAQQAAGERNRLQLA